MKKALVDALYDRNTGKVYLPHPEEEGIYVSPNHLKEILEGKVTRGKCTYTEEDRCQIWHKNPKTGDIECIKSIKVKTCECDCG